MKLVKPWLGVVKVGLLGGALLSAHAALAQEADQPQPVVPTPPLQESVPKSRLEGLSVQPGDDVLRTFQPKDSDEVARNKAKAIAEFMAGRVQEERGKTEEALASYLQAIKLDPAALSPYETALPLLIQRKRYDESAKLSLEAARANEKGFDLVVGVAVNLYANTRKVEQSVGLLRDALQLETLTKGSVRELLLQRRLGELYRVDGKSQPAAEQFKPLFAALTSGKFTSEEIKRVLTDPGQMFDLFGETFLETDQPELALQAFVEATKYRDEKPGLHRYNLALIFKKTNKPDDALKALQEYFDAQLQTRGRAAYVMLKELLAATGKESELLPRLEAMREKDRRNDVLRYFLADEQLNAGELKKAEQLYTNGVRNVADPRAVIGMFGITRRSNQPARLLEMGAKIFQMFQGEIRPTKEDGFEQSPEDIKALAQRFETELDALEKDEPALTALLNYARTERDKEDPDLEFPQAWFLGKLTAEVKRTADVTGFYKYAISMRNDPPRDLFQELASYLMDNDANEAAVEVLNEAIGHTSGNLVENRWMFLYFRSYAYTSLGQIDDALGSIRKAQELQPSVPDLFFQEGWVYTQAKKFDDALQVFARVMQKYAQDKAMVNRCKFVISAIYVEQGEKAKGEQVLEEILTEDPENTQANNDLGYLWADQNKNLEKSETMIRKALAEEPENPAYLDSLGWVLYHKGDFAGAVEHLLKATQQKGGEDATIHEHLGDTYQKLGREADAQASWKKALEQESKDKHPDEKLLKSLKEKIK